jgi:hypothetical protein
MFKTISFCLLAAAAITFSSCDKLKSVVPDLSITPNLSTGSIAVNAMTAGQTFTKEITVSTTDVTAALTKAGGSTSLVKKVVITGFDLTLDGAATWSFADVTSGEAFMDGTSIGTLPTGATGKTVALAIPANQADVKASILKGTGFVLKLTMVAKNATTASTVTGILKTKIDFSL